MKHMGLLRMPLVAVTVLGLAVSVRPAGAQTKQATQYFDKAEATAEGTELHLSVAMSGQKLTQLLPMLSMLAGGMPGMGGN